MRVDATHDTTGFRPVTVSLTAETQQEYDALVTLFRAAFERSRYGSDEENFAKMALDELDEG